MSQPIQILGTGSAFTFQTRTIEGIQLTADADKPNNPGPSVITIRILSTPSGSGECGNIDWFLFDLVGQSVAAPTNLQAPSVQSNSVQLTWADSATSGTTYRIERKQGTGAWGEIANSIAAGTETYTDTTVAPSMAYTYRVIAVSATLGESPASNERAVSTPAGATQTNTLNPSADTYVHSGNSGTNYGNATDILAKLSSGSYHREAYIRFDVAGVSSSASSVKLRVNGWRNSFVSSEQQLAFNVIGMSNTTWSESTTTYGTKPNLSQDTVVGTIVTDYQQNKWYEVDVTSYVNARIAAGATTVSFAVVGTVSGSDSNLYIVSREGANKPQLVVETAAPAQVPAAPSGLTASASGGTVNLSWTDNSSNETGFVVERANSSAFTSKTRLPAVTASSRTDQPGAGTWYYRVVAVNAAGDSAPSNTQSVAITTANIAVAEDTYVNSPNSNTATYGSSTTLQVKNASSTGNLDRRAFTKFSLSSVSGSVTSAKLWVYGSKNNPGESLTLQVFSVADTSWDANAMTYANQPGISENPLDTTGLEVSTAAQWYELDVTAYIQSQLTDGKSAVAFAFDLYESGSSAYFGISSAETANAPYLRITTAGSQPQVPAAPTDLSRVAPPDNAIAIRWTDNSSNEDVFEIQRRPLNGTWAGLTPDNEENDRDYNDNTYNSSQDTEYRVRAVNAIGASGWSNELQIPARPAAPTLTLSQGTVVIAWTDVSSIETGYRIERSTDGNDFDSLNPTSLVAASAGYSDTPAEPGTYYYRVRAIGTSAEGLPSPSAQASIVGVPAAPTNVSVMSLDGNSFRVSWATSTSTTHVRVTVTAVGATSGQNVEIETVGGSEDSYDVSGLIPGTDYDIAVVAYDAVNDIESDATAATFKTAPNYGAGYVKIYNKPGGHSNYSVGNSVDGGKTAYFVDYTYSPMVTEEYYDEDLQQMVSYTYEKTTGLENESVEITLKGLPPHAFVSTQSIILNASTYDPDANFVAGTLMFEVKGDNGFVEVPLHHHPSLPVWDDRNYYDNWTPESGIPFAHTSSDLTVRITGSGFGGNYNYSWWIQQLALGVYRPEVSITANTVTEGDGQKLQFTLTRDPNDPGSWDGYELPVSLDWSSSASAVPGDDFIGSLPPTVSFLPGQRTITFERDVVDDDDAEWTETVVGRLANGSIYTFANEATRTAKAEIKDNDLSIVIDEDVLIVNNDDSDNDGVIDLEDIDGVYGDDGLYAVQLSYPGGTSGEIRLFWPEDKVKVWKHSDRTGEVSRELGADYAVLPAGADALGSVFVEAVAGSSTVGDIVLLLQAIQGPATGEATDATTGSPATTQASTQPATAAGISVTIDSKAAVANQPVMVGQKASVQTKILGPGTMLQTGYALTGATFKDYAATIDSATLTQLADADLQWVPPQGDDAAKPNEVAFYWWKGEKTGKAETATVTASVRVDGKVTEISRKATFAVYSPEPTVTVKIGHVGRGRDVAQGPYVRMALGGIDINTPYGMQHTGNLTLPGPFAEGPAGKWYFTQLIDTANFAVINGALKKTAHTDKGFVLDGDVAYSGKTFDTGASTDPQFVADNPHNPFFQGMTWTGRDDVFHIYLMFVPSGANSRAVPILFDEVQWGGAVYYDGTTWQWDQSKPRYWTQPNPTPAAATAHPVWTQNNANRAYEDV